MPSLQPQERPNWRFVLSRPAHFLAFGFGSGLSPVAPGTAGTLAAFPLYWLLAPWLSHPAFSLLLLAGFVLGVAWCGSTGRALGVEDYGGIVWDEIVAFLLVLLWIPQGVFWFGAAFLLFRLLDIWKPFPIRQVERRLEGGLGVMVDDLIAAGYTLAIIHGGMWLR